GRKPLELRSGPASLRNRGSVMSRIPQRPSHSPSSRGGPESASQAEDHATEAEEERFRYGWRHVRVQHRDGSVTFKQVPLTLEDVLHPEFGDFIVRGYAQNEDLEYLRNALKARLHDHPTAIVLTKCGVFWDVRGLKHHCPDVAVIFGVDRDRER